MFILKKLFKILNKQQTESAHSSIITNYSNNNEILVYLPPPLSATHSLHNSTQHSYANAYEVIYANAYEVIQLNYLLYLLKSKNSIRVKRQRSRPEKWEYMRHILFFNTICLRVFLGSIWCSHKEIVSISLFSSLKINNTIFFNGFANVLNSF